MFDQCKILTGSVILPVSFFVLIVYSCEKCSIVKSNGCSLSFKNINLNARFINISVSCQLDHYLLTAFIFCTILDIFLIAIYTVMLLDSFINILDKNKTFLDIEKVLKNKKEN